MPNKTTTLSNFNNSTRIEISQPGLKDASIKIYETQENGEELSISLSKKDIFDLIKSLTELEKEMQG